MNGLFSSCLWRNSGCFLLFSFFFFFSFISNITAICENKIPPSLESAMISKELENSNLSYFSANLTDIFFFKLSPNIVGKLSPNIIKNRYLSFSGNPQSFSIILRLLMFYQIIIFFKFSYVVRFFTCKNDCLKLFVNDCRSRVSSSKSL